jgi:hypothetical protein
MSLPPSLTQAANRTNQDIHLALVIPGLGNKPKPLETMENGLRNHFLT